MVELFDLLTSCEVRKPSKKCRKGTRLQGGGLGDQRKVMRFLHGRWTSSMPKPVWRTAITSEWSPKIERAWAARERAATWKTVLVSSPAILYILGIISSRPCQAVKVVVSAAGLQCAVDRARGAAFGLHFDHRGDGAPQVGLALGGPFVGQFAHSGRGRNRIDGDDFVQSIGT